MNAVPASGPSSFLHYNPERVDYSLSKDELERVKTLSHNNWKDFCLVSVSVGLPCIINAIATTPNPFQLSLALFLNYLFGALGLILAVVFGIVWRNQSRERKRIFGEIEGKPLHPLRVETPTGSAASDATVIGSKL